MRQLTHSIALLLALAPVPLAQTPIGIGEVRLSSVSCGNTTKFSFAGVAGQHIVIHTTETDDFGGVCGSACCCFDQRIELDSPSGAVISSVDSPTSNNVCSSSGYFRTIMGPVELPETGDYTIRIRDKHNNGRGAVTLYLQSSDAPMSAFPLLSGDSLLFPLSTSGAVEAFTFTAAAGERAQASMTTESGSIKPLLALYRPDGLAQALPTNGTIDEQLPVGGTYTLLAYSTVHQKGTFRLDFDLSPVTPPQILYPGTFEDLELALGVNSQFGQFPDQQSTIPGDLVTLHLESPAAGFNATPFAVVAQLHLTGFPPLGPTPDLHFDALAFPPPFLLIDGVTGAPFAPVLPYGGATLSFITPPGLQGTSLMVQGVSLSPIAANGAYASTHGHELRFL